MMNTYYLSTWVVSFIKLRWWWYLSRLFLPSATGIPVSMKLALIWSSKALFPYIYIYIPVFPTVFKFSKRYSLMIQGWFCIKYTQMLISFVSIFAFSLEWVHDVSWSAKIKEVNFILRLMFIQEINIKLSSMTNLVP